MRILATKTIETIDAFLESDQGNAYRGLLQETLPKIGDAYAQESSGHRKHLGASLLGRKCSRELWYTFRWTTDERHSGRMIRLFNRGHLEEGRLVALLLMIGCRVFQFDDNGQQYRIVGHDGHYGGGLDCVVEGIPDCPGEPLLGEFKTHNKKSFEKLVDNGLYSAKFEHYVQMNQYMGAYSLRRGIYIAVCKDDDSLYSEIINYDEGVAAQANERAGRIIRSEEPPQRIAKTSSWYECKFCSHHGVCWGSKPPARNCRTCEFSSPEKDGAWVCRKHSFELSKEAQAAGCSDYTLKKGMQE